jgi:hypothetical protein
MPQRHHFHSTIDTDISPLPPSMLNSLIRANKGGKGGKKAGPTTSQDMGSDEDCTIYKDEGSTEEEDDNKESNEAKVKTMDSVKTGSSDFFVSSPEGDCEGYKESAIGRGDAQRKVCIGRGGMSLILHDYFVYSLRACLGYHTSSPFQECVCVEALVPVGSVLLDMQLQPLTVSPGEVLPHMWSPVVLSLRTSWEAFRRDFQQVPCSSNFMTRSEVITWPFSPSSPSEAAPCPLQPCHFAKWDILADTSDYQSMMGFPVCIFNHFLPIFRISCHRLMH